MDEPTAKYCEDILRSILEIETATTRFGREYNIFVSDFVFRRFIERNIEIMGEAMNRILKANPNVEITAARKIVDTRNYIIHAYDSLKPDILWAIVINHLPTLKLEVQEILRQ
ncbi:MAG: DUF86 domain-containing protein [Bacteroides sp.]|nr:DUF86 domain-containing protein [Bacteroides sp.]MCM1379360.1 DUF86 domain-containing protein [Bacteroides sp.]MCM1445220.1 DUF86 domain-containing protein [Prevotella sp.]